MIIKWTAIIRFQPLNRHGSILHNKQLDSQRDWPPYYRQRIGNSHNKDGGEALSATRQTSKLYVNDMTCKIFPHLCPFVKGIYR